MLGGTLVAAVGAGVNMASRLKTGENKASGSVKERKPRGGLESKTVLSSGPPPIAGEKVPAIADAAARESITPGDLVSAVCPENWKERGGGGR